MTGSASRALVLLSLLQTRRDWPGPVLAERMAVSERTLRRDVERLRDLGYRISAIKGPGGGYRLDAGSELPPLLFDDDQAIAVAVALQLAAVSGIGLGEAAARALLTVRQVMPSRLRHRVDGVAFTTLPAVAAPTVDPGVLVEVSAAVAAREVLRFDYTPVDRPADGAAGRRRIEPHHVVATGARWYLVGWDLDRDEWRVFRLDRVRPRIPRGPNFPPKAVPGGDVREFLAGRLKGSVHGNVWPCRGEVILELPAERVVPFVPDGIVEALGPERCRVALGSWSWIALAAALGRFDAPMTSAAPPELARAFAALAERFAQVATSSG